MLSRSINDNSSDWGTISRLSVALNTVFGRCIRKKTIERDSVHLSHPSALYASRVSCRIKRQLVNGVTPVFFLVSVNQ